MLLKFAPPHIIIPRSVIFYIHLHYAGSQETVELGQAHWTCEGGYLLADENQ